LGLLKRRESKKQKMKQHKTISEILGNKGTKRMGWEIGVSSNQGGERGRERKKCRLQSLLDQACITKSGRKEEATLNGEKYLEGWVYRTDSYARKRTA